MHPRPAGRGGGSRYVAGLAVLGFWSALVGAKPSLLAVGAIPAVLIVVLDPLRRFPACRLPRPLGLVVYAPHFAWRSVSGAVDVARRVLDPRLPVQPRFHCHPPASRWPAVRASHMAAISLMPGTLAAGVDDHATVVHFLAAESGEIAAMEQEEARLRRVFGEEASG